MANTLDPMDLKQILTLYKDGLSNRKIAETLGISRNTVNSYVKRFKGSKYGIDELLGFDNSKLEELFTFKTTLNIHRDRKSTRLNSSHVRISYAVFCLKKK